MICIAHLFVYQALLATQTSDVVTAGHQSIDDDVADLMDTSHASTTFNEQHAFHWAVGGCQVFTRNDPEDPNQSVCHYRTNVRVCKAFSSDINFLFFRA